MKTYFNVTDETSVSIETGNGKVVVGFFADPCGYCEEKFSTIDEAVKYFASRVEVEYDGLELTGAEIAAAIHLASGESFSMDADLFDFYEYVAMYK